MTIFGVVVFFVGWIYAIGAFGFFIGVGVGWIPALFLAMIVDTIFIMIFGMSTVVFKNLRK